MATTNTRQASRAPVTLKIKFKSETLDQFIERYSVDISHGGIFIRTKKPLEVGTNLKFEFQLKDESPLIQGTGTVVWTREPDSGGGKAPGMGVRFDKLSSDSQKVLDEVLAKKTSKSPSSQMPTAAPAAADDGDDEFKDTPTRVAPADLVDSLARNSNDDYDGGDMTPLPQPMPFHSDVDDYSDETFEESTKVASVESLLAKAQESAKAEDEDEDEVIYSSAPSPTSSSPKTEEPKEAPKAADASQYEDPFGDLNDDDDASGAEEDSISDRAATIADDAKTKAIELDPKDAAAAKAADEAEEAEAEAAAAATEPEPEPEPEASDDEEEEKPAKAVAASPTDVKEAVAEPKDEDSGSSMPWIAVAAVILIIGGAGGFWLLQKGKKDDGETSAKGQDKPAQTQEDPKANDGSDTPDPNAAANNTTPDAAPEPVEEDKPKTDVVIEVKTPEGATVSVVGTEFKSEAPATFQLVEGDTYTIEVSHPEFITQSIDVVADGNKPDPVALEAKAKLLRITSEPAGAVAFLNGKKLPGVTPMDVPLVKRLAKAKSARLQLRMPGYNLYNGTVALHQDFAEDGDTLVQTVTQALVQKAVKIKKPAGKKPNGNKPNGNEPDGNQGGDNGTENNAGGDNGTGGDSGAADKPEDKPDDKPADKPEDKPADKPADDPKPEGGDGSGSPTPDWMK